MKVWGVVVAAGLGLRFGGLKQHVELRGMPIWQLARQALLDGGVDAVVVVGPVEGGVPGGDRRRDSVLAGLSHVPAGADFVLIHDAARPLAGPDLVGRVIRRLRAGDVDGVVPVVPVRDTLKQVEGERITGTPDRSVLAAAQTPQGFRLEALLAAHRSYTGDAVDDASMVESTGRRVVCVEGDPANMKLTYPVDLRVLEALL